MKRTGMLAVAFLFVFAASAAFAAPGDVMHDIAAPGHYATGLTWDGKQLWVADRFHDELYAVNADGEVTKTLPAPGFIPRGLAWDGEYLWVIDGEENRILQLDVASGITRHAVDAPTPSPQGLAWDGENLWISDDRDDVVCQISTADGTVIERFPAPMKDPTGLEYWNGYLWCGDRRSDRIYLMDPGHGGEVVLSLDAPGNYVRGLASDGGSLWCVDYEDDRLYQLVIDDGEAVKTWDEHTLDLILTHEFRNYGPGEVPELDVYLAVPHEMPNQQLVTGPTFAPQPTDFPEDRWDQKVAHYHVENPAKGERLRMEMTARATLKAARWFVFPHKVGELKDIPKDVRSTYLVDEDKYRIDDPRIQKAVKAAIGDETNPYWQMRAIHKYIRDRLHYELSGGWNVAPRVLERGNGSCSEYTFLFISMCRAAGIPARYVGAVVIRGDEASTDEVFHRWSQVYLPNYGWIHVDPQGGDKELPGLVAESVGELPNRFLITTTGGGGSEFLGWNYNYDVHWTGKGPVKIHAEAVGEWSPAKPDGE